MKNHLPPASINQVYTFDKKEDLQVGSQKGENLRILTTNVKP